MNNFWNRVTDRHKSLKATHDDNYRKGSSYVSSRVTIQVEGSALWECMWQAQKQVNACGWVPISLELIRHPKLLCESNILENFVEPYRALYLIGKE